MLCRTSSLLRIFHFGLAAAEKQESLAVGGQAIMEGIMIRNADKLALAVRQSDERIVSQLLPWRVLTHAKWAKKPWIRGFPILIETMLNGIKALNISANLAAEAEGEEIAPWQLVLTMCIALGLALGLFVVVPHMITIGLGALSISGSVESISFHMWDGLMKMLIFVGYIALISRLPEIADVFAYHGAEHKVIAAYEHGVNPLTAEASLPFSRLHPRCGTTFLLFVLCISILLHTISVPVLLHFWQPANAFIKHSVVLCFKLLLMAPISAMAYEAIRYAARLHHNFLGNALRAPGLFLQLLTTREPSTKQLEVALVALHEALQEESYVTIQTTPYTRLEP